jgi:hypothetical protein
MTPPPSQATKRNDYKFANHAAVDPAFLKPIIALLIQWDDVHDPTHGYLNTFFPDAVFTLGSTTHTGHAEIRKSRENSTNPSRGPIVAVQHHLESVWPLAGEACQVVLGAEEEKIQELIFTGNTDYTLKSGKVINAAFASKVAMRRDPSDNGDYKFHDYMVYVNQVELMNAIAEFKN